MAALAQSIKPFPWNGIKLLTLTIKREGTVNWRIAGDTHCGPKSDIKKIFDQNAPGSVPGFNGAYVQVMPIKYTAEVTCEPNLDDRGFLFDQAMLHKWMERQATRESGLSCESLVIKVATDMLAKMAKDTPHCKVTSLILSFSPAPHSAAVTARFGV